MTRWIMAAALALFAVPASAQQSGVMGTWLTASGVAPEAATDYRNENPALRGRKVIGMPPIWGFKATSDPNTFESGQIYNGENGKTYSANISLQPDGKLRLRGYVGSPMFGETQLWTRVSQ
jgi:uncharacterized protein (DUF2147 family)